MSTRPQAQTVWSCEPLRATPPGAKGPFDLPVPKTKRTLWKRIPATNTGARADGLDEHSRITLPPHPQRAEPSPTGVIIRKCVCGGGKLLGGTHPLLPPDSVFFPPNAKDIRWEIAYNIGQPPAEMVEPSSGSDSDADSDSDTDSGRKPGQPPLQKPRHPKYIPPAPKRGFAAAMGLIPSSRKCEDLPCVAINEGEAYDRRMDIDGMFFINRRGAKHSRTACTVRTSEGGEDTITIRVPARA